MQTTFVDENKTRSFLDKPQVLSDLSKVYELGKEKIKVKKSKSFKDSTLESLSKNAQFEYFYAEYEILRAKSYEQLYSLSSDDKKISFSCDCPTILFSNHLHDTDELYIKDEKEYVRFATPSIVNRIFDTDLYRDYKNYVNLYHFYDLINKRFQSFWPLDYKRYTRLQFYSILEHLGYPSRSLKKLWKSLHLFYSLAKGKQSIDICSISLDNFLSFCGINQEFQRYFVNQLVNRYYYKTKNGHYKSYFSALPCGHCMLCRKTRSNDLAQRSILESQLYQTSPLMVTLTYDTPSLMSEAKFSLNKNHIANFLKKLRNHIGFEFYKDLVKYVPMYNAEHPEDHIGIDVLNKFSRNSSSHQKIYEEIFKPHKDFMYYYVGKCAEETRFNQGNKVCWMPQMFLESYSYSLDNLQSCGIRFLLCGEYGSNKKRAHYHLLLWNYPFVASKVFSFGGSAVGVQIDQAATEEAMRNLISNCWDYGDLGTEFVYADGKRGKALDIKTARNAGGYVTKYLSKQYKVGEVEKYYRAHKAEFNLTDEEIDKLHFVPPFLHWSNALGYVNPAANDGIKTMYNHFFKSPHNEQCIFFAKNVQDDDLSHSLVQKRVTLYNSPSFKYYFNTIERNSTLENPYRSTFYSHLLSLKEIYSATYPVLSYLRQKIERNNIAISTYKEYEKNPLYSAYFSAMDSYCEWKHKRKNNLLFENNFSFELHQHNLNTFLDRINLQNHSSNEITHRAIQKIYYTYRNSQNEEKYTDLISQYELLRTRIEKYLSQFGDMIKLPKSYDTKSTKRLQTPSVDYLEYLNCDHTDNLGCGVMPVYKFSDNNFFFDFSRKRELGIDSFFSRAYSFDKYKTNLIAKEYAYSFPICYHEYQRSLFPSDVRNQLYTEEDTFYLPQFFVGKVEKINEEGEKEVKYYDDYKMHQYEPLIDNKIVSLSCAYKKSFTLGEIYSEYIEHMLACRRNVYSKSAFFEVHDEHSFKPELKHKIDASFNSMVTMFKKNHKTGDSIDSSLYVNDKVDCQLLVNYIMSFATDEDFIADYNTKFNTLDYDTLHNKQLFFDKYCDDTFSKTQIDILSKIKDMHIQIAENKTHDKL